MESRCSADGQRLKVPAESKEVSIIQPTNHPAVSPAEQKHYVSLCCSGANNRGRHYFFQVYGAVSIGAHQADDRPQISQPAAGRWQKEDAPIAQEHSRIPGAQTALGCFAAWAGTPSCGIGHPSLSPLPSNAAPLPLLQTAVHSHIAMHLLNTQKGIFSTPKWT